MNPSPVPNTPARRLTGRLLAIDAANRVIRVTDGRQALDVRVPPGCDVRLNAEPIRLRLLEPGDPVEVEVIDAAGGAVAAAVRTGRVPVV